MKTNGKEMWAYSWNFGILKNSIFFKKAKIKSFIVLEFNKKLKLKRPKAEVIDKSAASEYELLRDFESLKILNEITGLERKRLYVFTEYLDLFTKNEKH